MIFYSPGWLLLTAVVGLGLFLLVGTLATRGPQVHAVFHKATWLGAAAIALAYVNGGAAFVALFAGSAIFNYWAARSIERQVDLHGSAAGRAWIFSALGANLLVLLLAKSLPWLHHTPRMDAVGAAQFGGAFLPVGVSFFAFQGASYLVDVFRTRTAAQGSPSRAAVYLLLLPQFVAGPIAYEAVAGQLSRRSVGMSDFAYGTRRLVIGIGKRVFIASACATVANEVFRRRPEDLTAGTAWLGAACFAIQVYFTFSAYADMALGLGRLFGLRLEENFRWPYEAGSIEGFWSRWHMGLVSWFRHYCWPVGEDWRNRALLRDACVIVLCAGWYGLTWGCLAWGTYHAGLLALERRRVINVGRLPAFFGHAYLVAAVIIGWVFVRAATVPDAVLVFKAMAGLNTPVVIRPLRFTNDVWLAVAAGAIGSAPLARSLRRWSVVIDAATTTALMMLFAVAVYLLRWVLVIVRGGFSANTPGNA